MLIKLPRSSECKASEITPEGIYLSRRTLLGARWPAWRWVHCRAWGWRQSPVDMPMSRQARRQAGSVTSFLLLTGKL